MSVTPEDYEKAKEYYGKAKKCLDDGSGSDACKDLVKEGGEKALIAAGVDPQVARETMECIDNQDSEACAKASAKIAAVYACSSATAGVGYVACSKLAPVIIDKIWPVAGPPLTMTWDVALDVLRGVVGALSGIVDALGGILGFGDDGPTKTEMHNELMWRGSDILSAAIESSVVAVSNSDIESRLELGLPVTIPNGSTGDPSQFSKSNLSFSPNDARSLATQNLSSQLKSEPGFGQIAVAARNRNGNTDFDKLDFRFVDPSVSPKPGEIVMVATGCPPDWTIDKANWNPAGFKLTKHQSTWVNMWTFNDVRDAYGMILSERTSAVRNAASTTVGRTIAKNISDSKGEPKPISESEGAWLWWAAIIGGGVLAYVNRAKIVRIAKRLTR